MGARRRPLPNRCSGNGIERIHGRRNSEALFQWCGIKEAILKIKNIYLWIGTLRYNLVCSSVILFFLGGVILFHLVYISLTSP